MGKRRCRLYRMMCNKLAFMQGSKVLCLLNLLLDFIDYQYGFMKGHNMPAMIDKLSPLANPFKFLRNFIKWLTDWAFNGIIS